METKIYEPGVTLFFLDGAKIYKSELKSVISEKTTEGISVKYVFNSPHIGRMQVSPANVSPDIEDIYAAIPVLDDASYEDLPF